MSDLADDGSESNPKPTAFVKWVGGKRQLLPEIKKRLPHEFNRYFEPFLGGGSVLFDILPKHPVINDINPQLVNAYRQIKDSPTDVIKKIENIDLELIMMECDYQKMYALIAGRLIDSTSITKDFYYSIRERYNSKIEKNEKDIESAALMIWLNKHCFNGVYRVNSKGQFNVPYNNSIDVKTIDPSNILAISKYLKDSDAEIINDDFSKACKTATKGDFVYFDSPYIPESKTANFVDYTKTGFSYDDHVRLSELFKTLDSKGVKVMLSNNDVDLVHELYSGFNISPISARRSVNRNANGRVGKEVIITNYDYEEAA